MCCPAGSIIYGSPAFDVRAFVMIAIHCTQCKQLLEMDEAFAGGVCRCQFCGTIQTVPSRLKSSSKSSGSSGKSSSTKALYKKGSAGAPQTGTGLDELAEIVASSGLARGSLSKPPPKQGRDAAASKDTPGRVPAKSNPMLPWLIGAGGLVAVLLVLVLYLAFGRGNGTQRHVASGNPSQSTGPRGTVDPSPAGPVSPTPVVPAGPSFAGLTLSGRDAVVYVIDRSQANEDIFDAMVATVYQSVASLGPSRQFQIIFWHRNEETPSIIAFPEEGLAPATREQIEAAEKRFEDVSAYWNTDLKPTVEKAAKSGAGTMIIVSAKGYMLEDADALAVQAALKGKPVRVHTFALGETESPVLKQIADQTGGHYRAMQYNQLRSLVR